MESERSENEGFEQDSEHSDEEGAMRLGDIYIPPPPKPACSVDSQGPRLIISYIVCENFKSFAGKKYIGPFYDGFNAIIGPNGSGKSNVIDSLLFVFGYRATKVRSKNISVLIHKSKAHDNIESCSVVVHFAKENTTGNENDTISSSELSIGRTAFRNNTSFYTLNNNRVKFKEVSEFLHNNGIDLTHHRFLILQGEVESIALMKPKGRYENDAGLLEFLEDIIGTSRFKVPITQLQKKIEDLKEQEEVKLESYKNVLKDKQQLEGPKNEVLIYMKTENEISKLKNELMQKYMKDNQQLIDKKEQEKLELQRLLEERLSELEILQKEREKLLENIHELNQERDQLIMKKDRLKRQSQNYDNEGISLKAECKAATEKQARLNEILENEKKQLSNYEELLEKYQEQLLKLEDEEMQINNDCVLLDGQMKEALEQVKEEIADLCDEKNTLQSQLAEIQEVVDGKKSQYEVAKSELEIYVHPERTEKEKLKRLTQNLKKLTQHLSVRKVENQQTLERLPIIEQELVEAKNKKKQLAQEEEIHSKQLHEIRMKLHEVHQTMRKSVSSNKVVEYLMTCKAENKIPGLFGRLGDLGAIDEMYDVAISTACGYLNHMVADTVKTAQKCIELLRQSNIGQASFIALEYQQKYHSACYTRPETPENVPRLVDLIKLTDERVRVAFYFALRDTLAANDVAQATRVAFCGEKRNRVVTLKGHIIEATGEMTGGGHTVKKGLMSQKVAEAPVSQETIDELGKKMHECQQKLTELTRKIHEIDQQIAFLAPELNNMNIKAQKLETEIMTLERDHPKVEDEVKNQQKRVLEVAADPAKVASLTVVLEKAKEEYNDAMQAAEEVTSKVNCINNKIEDKINNRVGLIKKDIEKNKKKLSSKCHEVTKTKADIKSVEKNITKGNKKIEETEREITETEEVINAYHHRNSSLLNLIKDINIELNKIIESVTDLENHTLSLQNEVKSTEQIEFQKRGVIQELEASVHAKEKTIKEYKAKNPCIINKMKSLKIHEIPGEDVDTHLPVLTSEQIDKLDVKRLQYNLAVLEEKLSTQKPNFAALEEYMIKEKLLLEQYESLQKLKNLQGKTNFLFDEARKQRFLEFMTGYRIIAKVLKEIYQIITFGGDAEIELVDQLDPFSEGIIFSVRPPQKAWKNIEHLSGGEKTLSSLALIFALHFYKPSPLFVMDEIDAALDFNNVAVISNYIKNRCKNAQFVVISLRSDMFELADRIIGIFKVHDCTESMTINPRTYVKNSPEQQELLEGDIEYEILENVPDKMNENDLLPLPNNKSTMRRRRRIKIKKIGEHGSTYSLMNILQTAFTAMMGNVENSSPVVQTREEIEERIKRKSGINDCLDEERYAALMKEFLVKKGDQTVRKGHTSETQEIS